MHKCLAMTWAPLLAHVGVCIIQGIYPKAVCGFMTSFLHKVLNVLATYNGN